MAKQVMGTNIVGEVKDGVLHLEIDLRKTQGISKSGKSRTVATTSGNVTVPNAPDGKLIKLGINAYTAVE